MPPKGYKSITISTKTRELLDLLKQRIKAERGHDVSDNDLLLEILTEYLKYKGEKV